MTENTNVEEREAQLFLRGRPPTPPPLPPSLRSQLPLASAGPPAPPKLPPGAFQSPPKQSIMAANFAAAQEAQLTGNIAAAEEPIFRPCHFFFYGSLMDPKVLQTVTRSSVIPVMQKGWIKGFRMKMWGIYPALVPEDGGEISGTVWKVEDIGQFLYLQQYETNHYTPRSCTIYTEAGETLADGMTFCWAGDPESEELEDGIFDIEWYQKYFKQSVVGE